MDFTDVCNSIYILQLVTSRVSCHGHMIVMLQFFETVVRYDKFFNCEPQHIPDVLVSIKHIEYICGHKNLTCIYCC